MGFALQEVEKYGCKIVTVEPAQRRIEGVIKSGAVVQVAVYTVDPFFRWPKVGENWMIRRENGTWYLDSKWQNQEGESEANTTIINNLSEGDALIDTPTGNVYLTSGDLLATKIKVVTTLPESPTNGQEVLYQTSSMASEAVMWKCRYNSESISTFKWEVFGGTPIQRFTSGSSAALTANTWTKLGGCSISLPHEGIYLVTSISQMLTSTTSIPVQSVGVGINGAAPSGNEVLAQANQPAINGFRQWLNVTCQISVTGGSPSIEQWFMSNVTETVTSAGCHLIAMPVRI